MKEIEDLPDIIADLKSSVDEGAKLNELVKDLTDDLGVMFYYGESPLNKSEKFSKEFLYKRKLLQ